MNKIVKQQAKHSHLYKLFKRYGFKNIKINFTIKNGQNSKSLVLWIKMCSKLYEFNKYKISNDNNELISKKIN